MQIEILEHKTSPNLNPDTMLSYELFQKLKVVEIGPTMYINLSTYSIVIVGLAVEIIICNPNVVAIILLRIGKTDKLIDNHFSRKIVSISLTRMQEMVL